MLDLCLCVYACLSDMKWIKTIKLNLLRPSNAYMRQQNIPSLVQILACWLIGAKPLSEPMLPYGQLGPEKNITVEFYLEFKSFHSIKSAWKSRLQNGVHFVSTSVSRVTLYTAGHLHTAVPHCWHSRAPIVHTAVPRENNEHGCVYLLCRAVCKLPGCVEGHLWVC